MKLTETIVIATALATAPLSFYAGRRSAAPDATMADNCFERILDVFRHDILARRIVDLCREQGGEAGWFVAIDNPGSSRPHCRKADE